jgi:SAM-dependent methyltransferase
MTSPVITSTAAQPEIARPKKGHCRFCGESLQTTFVDLGMSPLCESYPSVADLNQGEVYYPLHVYVCGKCLLVQLEEYEKADNIFTEYAYFSSYSDSWLRHCQNYCDKMIERFHLNPASHVVEVASNDGYLLQYFVEKGIPALGIEPAANVAKVAVEKGVPTLVKFFGAQLATELAAAGAAADLVLGNNVLAQVPDLNDFVAGLRIILKPEGVLTLEFPHLLTLIDLNEFDTIYHEHFSYFSVFTTRLILEAHGLRIFDIEELPTHGGSLRIYACHAGDDSKATSSNVAAVLAKEQAARLTTIEGYAAFARKVQETKWELLEFLIRAKRGGKSVAGYGAPGKGTTMLVYCGIGRDFLDYTVDRNPYKHGRCMPGMHIPIFSPEKIRETKPDYVFILPWNLKDEIMEQLSYIREWGGRFLVPIPRVQVY